MVRKLKTKKLEVETTVDTLPVEKAPETRYEVPKRTQKAPPVKQIRKTQGK